MDDKGVFDLEALSLMRTAMDHAWEALPPDHRTPEARERLVPRHRDYDSLAVSG
jgi:hypothetical protein